MSSTTTAKIPTGSDGLNDKQKRRAKFDEAYQVAKKDLVHHIKDIGMPPDVVQWYEKNLDYNVPGGKLNRGLSVIDTAEILKGRSLTDEEYLKAAVLGWCVELFQAHFLVLDDKMDGSLTRRGQPCYYRVVGEIALNDACILESAIFFLIRKYFAEDPSYVNLMEITRETAYQTQLGQLIDTITSVPQDSPQFDLKKFTMDKYRLIVLYKTAYYSFYLPVAMAMLMCGMKPSKETVNAFTLGKTYSTTHRAPITTSSSSSTTDPFLIAQSILLPTGEYFQIQDDYLDAFGGAEQIGKIGTDIVDGKCSWCVCTALELCSPAQRELLNKHYGVHAPDSYKASSEDDLGPSEKKVKELYDELGLREVYRKYEEDSYEKINGMIAQVEEREGGLKRQVFTSFLEKIYKRSK